MPSYDVVERDWTIKVNANECNMNLPPMVEDRLMGRLSRVAFNRYPNEEYDALREQIAQNHSLQKENVLIGSGSSEIIEKLFYCFGGTKAKKIVYPEPSFSMYRIYAKAAQALGVPVALESDYTLDLEKFVNTVNENKAGLAVLCNPNNPTADRHPHELVLDAARQLHKRGGWLIVDEAFVDATPELSVTPLAGTPEAPNLIVLRSLGKFFGLAGVRVGFVFAAPELLRRMQEAMGPWAVSGPSREAARLALADTAWQAAARPQLQAAGERLRQLLVPLGEVKATALFATLSSPHSNELFDYLARRAILTRRFDQQPLLRFGLPGDETGWQRLAAALNEWKPA